MSRYKKYRRKIKGYCIVQIIHQSHPYMRTPLLVKFKVKLQPILACYMHSTIVSTNYLHNTLQMINKCQKHQQNSLCICTKKKHIWTLFILFYDMFVFVLFNVCSCELIHDRFRVNCDVCRCKTKNNRWTHIHYERIWNDWTL